MNVWLICQYTCPAFFQNLYLKPVMSKFISWLSVANDVAFHGIIVTFVQTPTPTIISFLFLTGGEKKNSSKAQFRNNILFCEWYLLWSHKCNVCRCGPDICLHLSPLDGIICVLPPPQSATQGKILHCIKVGYRLFIFIWSEWWWNCWLYYPPSPPSAASSL